MSTIPLSRSFPELDPSPSLSHFPPQHSQTLILPNFCSDLVSPTQHPPFPVPALHHLRTNPPYPYSNSLRAITQANQPKFAGVLKAFSWHQEHPLAHILSFHPLLFQQLSSLTPFCSDIAIYIFIVHLALPKEQLNLIKPSRKMHLQTKTKPVKWQPQKPQLEEKIGAAASTQP